MASNAMCDVAVVGAGPVGLILALLLHASGHKVTVFERYGRAFALPRAVGLDHQSMRVIDGLGLLEDMTRSQAIQDFTSEVCEIVDGKGEVLAYVPFNAFPSSSGTVPGFSVHQPTFEGVLERVCLARNIPIHRGVEVKKVTDKGNHVELCLFSSGLSSTENARFVVGCDGANSTVRESVGIRFIDQPGVGSRWLVVDILPKDLNAARNFKDRDVARHYFDPARPRSSIPSPENRRRWEFMLLPTEDRGMVLNDAFIWTLLEEFLCTPESAMIERRTVYRLRGAWAETWNRGRVLLAGDAAHVTPQFMGQGINGGIRDAKSLAWRLDLALKDGECKWERLFTYYTTEQLRLTRDYILTSLAFERTYAITDQAEAEIRDRKLKEEGYNYFPDLEKLGSPGIYIGPADSSGSEEAGTLFMLDKVERDGRKGTLNNMLGEGWQLLGPGPLDPIHLLTAETQSRYKDGLGGVSAHFGKEGGYTDLSGRYTSWFKASSARAVLVRPDYYIFGIATIDDHVEAVVRKAWESVMGGSFQSLL